MNLKSLSLVAIATLSIGFTACGGGGSSSSGGDNGNSGTTTNIEVERGKVYDANVTDSSTPPKIATMTVGSNVYTFSSTPTYPIKAVGGWIDVDGDGEMSTSDVVNDLNLTSYSKVITPVTTYLGDTDSSEGKSRLVKLIADMNTTEADLLKVPSKSAKNAIIAQNAIYNVMKTKGTTNIRDYYSDINSSFSTLKTYIESDPSKTTATAIALFAESKIVADLVTGGKITKLDNSKISDIKSKRPSSSSSSSSVPSSDTGSSTGAYDFRDYIAPSTTQTMLLKYFDSTKIYKIKFLKIVVDEDTFTEKGIIDSDIDDRTLYVSSITDYNVTSTKISYEFTPDTNIYEIYEDDGSFDFSRYVNVGDTIYNETKKYKFKDTDDTHITYTNNKTCKVVAHHHSKTFDILNIKKSYNDLLEVECTYIITKSDLTADEITKKTTYYSKGKGKVYSMGYYLDETHTEVDASVVENIKLYAILPGSNGGWYFGYIYTSIDSTKKIYTWDSKYSNRLDLVDNNGVYSATHDRHGTTQLPVDKMVLDSDEFCASGEFTDGTTVWKDDTEVTKWFVRTSGNTQCD